MHHRQQFERLTASELYCPRCRQAQPVRERLLLVLPGAELYEYRCGVCQTSLASREVSQSPPELLVPRAGGLAGARPPI